MFVSITQQVRRQQLLQRVRALCGESLDRQACLPGRTLDGFGIHFGENRFRMISQHPAACLAGQRVSLSYEEHPGIPTSCFGDTAYFIVKVTPISDAVPLPATPPPAPPSR